MKHRSTQFGPRKNPGSETAHGLRLRVDSFLAQSQGAVENLGGNEASSPSRVASVIERRSNSSLSHLRDARTTGSGDDIRSSVVNAEKGNDPPGIERPITSKEASQVLGVHPRTIKRMARDGKVPGHFRFGRWYFYASELDCWMRMELNSARHP
jgi:excisionase family DNA binding protein